MEMTKSQYEDAINKEHFRRKGSPLGVVKAGDTVDIIWASGKAGSITIKNSYTNSRYFKIKHTAHDINSEDNFVIYEKIRASWFTPKSGPITFKTEDDATKYIRSIGGQLVQNSFSNGRAKAQQEIANKWPVLNAIRTMSKSEILKRAKEGRWELQQDLDGKQNGQYVEVRMPNGSRQQIKIEGD